jgi:hypothetical protein
MQEHNRLPLLGFGRLILAAPVLVSDLLRDFLKFFEANAHEARLRRLIP